MYGWALVSSPRHLNMKERKMPKRSAKKQTSLLIPGNPTGSLSIAALEDIIALARTFGVREVQITSAKRLALCGFAEADREELATAVAEKFQGPDAMLQGYIVCCRGRRQCPHGCRQTEALSQGLTDLLASLSLPAKVKIGISGCPRNCSAGSTRDVGLFANMKGWVVVFGGNAGCRPRIADTIAEGLSRQAALQAVEKCLDFYSKNALPRERTARFVERLGITTIKEIIIAP
ncbi:MAG: sulfite reductase, assimilatory-type [Desulfobulbaceae bacterium]|nr:MAG: sulfite reductase, assimilatory-type [Desulfobulbaceae bacterium]